jgi:hypothetical protein
MPNLFGGEQVINAHNITRQASERQSPIAKPHTPAPTHATVNAPSDGLP